MIATVKHFISSLISDEHPKFDNTLAIASLLCEVCIADHHLSADEKIVATRSLEKVLNVNAEKAAELLSVGMQEAKSSQSVFDFTSQLGDLEREQRIELIKVMWQVAYADGHLDEMEEALIRKVATLIYVNHSDFIRTKLAVMPQS